MPRTIHHSPFTVHRPPFTIHHLPFILPAFFSTYIFIYCDTRTSTICPRGIPPRAKKKITRKGQETRRPILDHGEKKNKQRAFNVFCPPLLTPYFISQVLGLPWYPISYLLHRRSILWVPKPHLI